MKKSGVAVDMAAGISKEVADKALVYIKALHRDFLMRAEALGFPGDQAVLIVPTAFFEHFAPVVEMNGESVVVNVYDPPNGHDKFDFYLTIPTWDEEDWEAEE